MYRQLTSIYLPLIVMLPAIAVAQGTQADYDRANSLRETTRNTVFRQKVEPNWTADDKRLWYQIEVAPGEFEFVIVNAIAGTRELALETFTLSPFLTVAGMTTAWTKSGGMSCGWAGLSALIMKNNRTLPTLTA